MTYINGKKILFSAGVNLLDVPIAQKTGDSVTAVMSQKAVVNNFLHPAGFLAQETEGLTDADSFPYNTCYTIIEAGNVSNIPEKAGTLITFGSTNPNTGASQLFISYTYQVWSRIRFSSSWGEWKCLSTKQGVTNHTDELLRYTIAMKTGKMITSAQEAPLDNADTYPINTIYTFVGAKDILNIPNANGTMMTFNYSNSSRSGGVQLFVTNQAKLLIRANWSSAWSEWVEIPRLEELKSNFLHQSAFLNSETEGLTDADSFPFNTIYTITELAKVANIPATNGTLITFGSTNVNTGATQMFFDVYGVSWYRRKHIGAWSAWSKVATYERIESRINENNSSTVGLKFGGVLTESNLPADSLDSFPKGFAYLLNNVAVTNAPEKTGTLFTLSNRNSNTGAVQIFVGYTRKIYIRSNFSSTWNAWETLGTVNAVEEVLNTKFAVLKESIAEYVSLSMFEKFGVIGDSYSSGAIYVLNEDGTQKSAGSYYNLSWGQIMARKLGTTCTNFSKGGLHTRSWLTDDKGLPLLLSSEPQNIYYLMLGINDKAKLGVDYIGTLADIKDDFNQNADTFYGNYGKIIGNIKAHAPNAKIIISTMTGTTGTNKSFNDAIEAIATHFGIPCVKQYENEFFKSDFYKKNIIKDHPTAPVYSGMANALQKMFEDAVKDNVAYFNDYIG